MKDRIYQLMQHTGLKQAEFAERLGMSAGSVSNIFTGRTNPTNNHVQAIHRAFPQVNINWLLFGEGEMMDHAEGDADAPSPDAAPAAEGAPAATLPTASTGRNGGRPPSHPFLARCSHPRCRRRNARRSPRRVAPAGQGDSRIL